MCIFTPIRRLLGLFVGAGVLAVSACGTDQGPLEPDPQTLSPEVSFARVGKSPVCHWSEDDERFFKIRVAERAIPAHLRHGDGLIGAPVPDQGGFVSPL